MPHRFFPVIPGVRFSFLLYEQCPFNDWLLKASLYILPTSLARIGIPFHRCVLELDVPGLRFQPSFAELSLKPLMDCVLIGSDRYKEESTSLTIKSTSTEVIIDGPGLIRTEVRSCTPIVSETLPNTALFKLSPEPNHSAKPAVVSGVLNRVDRGIYPNEAARWIV